MHALERLLDEARTTSTTGWDFTRLGDRVKTVGPPWVFEETVAAEARRVSAMLDLGTGGGDWLAALPYRAPRTVATEGWRPNVTVAHERLRTIGVPVVEVGLAPDNVDQEPGEPRGGLPFIAESFGLVCSRHESFVADEVARILRPGGVFLTQQTGGNYDDFYDLLSLPRPRRSRPVWDVRLAGEQLGSAGLRVVAAGDGAAQTTFADVGAVAWYLRAVPWTVTGFSIESHRPQLEQLHRRLLSGGPLTVRMPSFWLKAAKSA